MAARSLGRAAAVESSRGASARYEAMPLPLASATLTYRWVCLGLLFGGIVLAFFVRLAPAVVIPDLQRSFDLNVAQVGLLTSLFMWPFALMQLTAGVLADWIGARRCVALFLAIAGAGELVFALAPSAGIALLGRGLTGIGFGTLFVGATLIMAEWFRPREFATLTGIWTSVGNLGSLVATAPLALLAAEIGWRASFGGVGVAVLVLAGLILLFLRDRPGEMGLPSIAEIDGTAPTRRARDTSTWREGVGQLLRTKETWYLCAYGFTLFGTMTMAQGFYAVPYLIDVHGLGQQHTANLLSFWAVGLIVGCSLWGTVSDRLGARKPIVLWGAVAYAALWVPPALDPQGPSPGVLWLGMLWGGFFAATWIPCYALLRNVVPAQVIGTAIGLLNLSLWLGGAAYQQAAGSVLERFTSPEGATLLIGHQLVIWLALGSVAASIAFIAACRER